MSTRSGGKWLWVAAILVGYVAGQVLAADPVYTDVYQNYNYVSGETENFDAGTGQPLYFLGTANLASADACTASCNADAGCLGTNFYPQSNNYCYTIYLTQIAGSNPFVSFDTSEDTALSWRYSNVCNNVVGDLLEANSACSCGPGRRQGATPRQCEVGYTDGYQIYNYVSGQTEDFDAGTGEPLYFYALGFVDSADACTAACDADNNCLGTNFFPQSDNYCYTIYPTQIAGSSPFVKFVANQDVTLSWRYSGLCNNALGDLLEANSTCACGIGRTQGSTPRQCVLAASGLVRRSSRTRRAHAAIMGEA